MTTIKVTGQQISEAAEALRYICGINDETDGNKKARCTFKPKVKILLAKKLRQLTDLVTGLEDLRKELMEELGIKPGVKVEDPAVVGTYNTRWEALLAAEQEVEIGLIEESTLDLETNDIPAGHLAALDSFIKWADTPA